jgi:hypothetical protein
VSTAGAKVLAEALGSEPAEVLAAGAAVTAVASGDAARRLAGRRSGRQEMGCGPALCHLASRVPRWKARNTPSSPPTSTVCPATSGCARTGNPLLHICTRPDASTHASRPSRPAATTLPTAPIAPAALVAPVFFSGGTDPREATSMSSSRTRDAGQSGKPGLATLPERPHAARQAQPQDDRVRNPAAAARQWRRVSERVWYTPCGSRARAARRAPRAPRPFDPPAPLLTPLAAPPLRFLVPDGLAPPPAPCSSPTAALPSVSWRPGHAAGKYLPAASPSPSRDAV